MTLRSTLLSARPSSLTPTPVKEKRGVKILIVDDEAHIRALVEQTLEDLEDEGVELLSADNGEDALALIQAEQPELVFLDVMMPRMNGFDVCYAVKHELGMAGVYIVLLTAKGQVVDREKGMEVGADTYMTKPFSPAMLRSLATDVLGL
ncbi:MAG: response regulator [Anaerolineae bacterium]|nr:response regulator [Anaerolineae bacterium]